MWNDTLVETTSYLLIGISRGRDKSATPSGFTLKLRKHVRTRRLEDVRQLGIDRVIFSSIVGLDFLCSWLRSVFEINAHISMIVSFQVIDLQFGMGEGTHHIILELYAQGNILLTDGDYNVLTLLRTHRFVFKL